MAKVTGQHPINKNVYTVAHAGSGYYHNTKTGNVWEFKQNNKTRAFQQKNTKNKAAILAVTECVKLYKA